MSIDFEAIARNHLRQMVVDWAMEEADGREHDFATRLDNMSDDDGDKVLAAAMRLVKGGVVEETDDE